MPTYYVNSSSTGTGNGTTTAITGANAAFKTISKVNSGDFSGGDSILFNRGDTWREQLIPQGGSVSSGYITYGVYGSGNKPKLLGSISLISTGNWTDEGGNLWYATSTTEVGNIIFNNEVSCGVKVSAKVDCNAQGKFWWDDPNDRIYVYSVGNPATFYTNIECALAQNIITANDKYVIIENLDLRYGGIHSISFAAGAYSIIIRNCDISYIGGGATGVIRYGNGIQFWNGAHDIIIEKNKIDNIYDAGITKQGIGTFEVYNIYVRNNIITNCEYSLEFWHTDDTSSVHDVYFENNTCVNAGGGWGHNQRPDGVNGRHIFMSNNTAITSNVYFRNNIFDTATESLICINHLEDVSDVNIDYNNLYQSSGHIGTIVSTDYDTLVAWRTASSQDSHSISSNPLLNSDYTLQSGSPCIDTGLTIATVTDDYWNRTRAVGRYDIGVLEYGNMGFIRTGKFGTDKFGKGKFGRKPF